MAGIYCGVASSSCLALRRSGQSSRVKTTHLYRIRCSSSPDDTDSVRGTPRLIKFAVSGVTELLRLFTSSNNNRDRLERESYKQKDEISVLSVDDVLNSLKCDYENAYFVTGVFTSAIYAEDCIYEDPTIRFQGKDLYSRNLKLVVPFFDQPSIALQNIEKGISSEMTFVLARWKLRTYLKLPWRPLISINGSTVYELDDKFKIVRHAEKWDVSALEAVGQIFAPNFGRPIN